MPHHLRETTRSKRGDPRRKRGSNVLQLLVILCLFVQVVNHVGLLQCADTSKAPSAKDIHGFSPQTTGENNAEMHIEFLIPILGNDEKLLLFAQSIGSAIRTTQTRGTTYASVGFGVTATRYKGDIVSESFRMALSELSQCRVSFVALEDAKFSRAKSINRLLSSAQCQTPKACAVAVVDVDMEVGREFLDSLISLAKTRDKIYFPIVWSQYNPHAVMLAEKIFGHLDKFSEERGLWRTYGYGMFATTGLLAKKIMLNEDFDGWGGEDVDLFKRAQEMNLTILREKEPGLIHVWHDKHCKIGATVSKNFYKKCVHSKRRLEGSELINGLDQYFRDYLLSQPDPKNQRTTQEGRTWIREMWREYNEDYRYQ